MSIRPATLDDAGSLAAIYGPYVADTAISFEVVPPTDAEMRERIRTTLVDYPWLVWEEAGQARGYAYATQHRTRKAYQWAVDVSVYIDSAYHGRGAGRRLYGALFEVLVRQGFVQAYAGITLPNEKSVGLHEALGFAPVGIYRRVGFKHGQWRDVGWWCLELQRHPADPAPPVPWSALEG